MAKTTVPAYLSAQPSIIDAGDATAITIDSSENITIGGQTNHDGAALLLSHGDSGVTTFSDNADELVIENASNAGISILTPANGTGSVVFGDSDDNDIGKIEYNHSTDDLTLTAADDINLVTGSGNVGVTGTMSVSGAITASLTGNVTGNVTGSAGSATGNSATATEATNITAVANNSANETVYPTFVDGATGTQGLETDTGLTYNPSTGVITATQFTGNVTGNVTGNASGTALTVTQAAQSAITSVGTLTALTGGTGDLVWDTPTFVVDSSTNRVGIGTTSPLEELDLVGQFISANNKTDDTDKQAIFLAHQYDSGTETEGFMMMETYSGSSVNRVDIGGGHSGYNAATEITFNTAANNTTRTGSERMCIDTGGTVGIGVAAPTRHPLHINGGSGTEFHMTNTNSGDGVSDGFMMQYDSNKDIGIVNMESGGDMYFGVDNNTNMTLLSGGNFGIGTTSPIAKLTIQSKLNDTLGQRSETAIQINTTGAAASQGIITMGKDTGTWAPAFMGFKTTSATGDTLGDIVFGTRNVTSDTAPTERMRIASNGDITFDKGITIDGGLSVFKSTGGTTELALKVTDSANNMVFQVQGGGGIHVNYGPVGIGTTSPSAKLHVDHASTTTSAAFFYSNASNTVPLVSIKQDGAGSNSSAPALKIENDGAGDPLQVHSTHAGGLAFYVNYLGKVIAPYLNQTASTTNRYPLYWVHSGTVGGIEPYTGSVRAMKTDIADMSSVNWVHSLTPRSFKFRDYTADSEGTRTYLETTNDLPNTEYGLIAEEVDAVSGSDYILDKDSEDNVKGVLYHNLVPILLKAVQELEARIAILESE